MKISNKLIAFIILFSVACSTKNEHGTEDGNHSHDDDKNHEEQEEFTAGGDSTDEKIKRSNNEKKSTITTSIQENEVTVVVPSKKGIEYVFYIKEHEKLTYEWTSDAPIYLQFHGEPMDFEVTKYFEVYTEATSDEMKGIMTLPFEGTHGWYWKNTSENDISINLKTKGNYNVIGLKK